MHLCLNIYILSVRILRITQLSFLTGKHTWVSGLEPGDKMVSVASRYWCVDDVHVHSHPATVLGGSAP